jgi:hypothetical protein
MTADTHLASLESKLQRVREARGHQCPYLNRRSNVGLDTRRQRFRIAPQAIDDFLATRAVRPTTSAARPRRRKPEHVTEYF